VSGTPTSILADGAAGFFVFKAGTGRRLVRLFGLRGFLWSREEREGVFFTRRFAGGMGGREPGGERPTFPVCEGGAAVRWRKSVLFVAFTCSDRFHSGFQHLCPVSQV
jgi:hypothetical protein